MSTRRDHDPGPRLDAPSDLEVRAKADALPCSASNRGQGHGMPCLSHPMLKVDAMSDDERRLRGALLDIHVSVPRGTVWGLSNSATSTEVKQSTATLHKRRQ
jgi:hypothetical protein